MPSALTALWSTDEPATWPTPPSPMSISRLREAETCARRVALRTADYPRIWEGRGYPPRFTLSAFVGKTVHAAVERIVIGLRQRGCSTTNEPAAVEVISEMGGFTRVAEESVVRLLEQEEKNPRFAAFRENAVRLVRGQVPEIRRRIQALLCQMKLGVCPPASGRIGKGRFPLSAGIYSEVWLEAPDLAWAGRADQIVVADRGAEITEFKTGEPDPEHAFQLHVYALLWTRDLELNPSGRAPAGLHLRYLNRSHRVAVPGNVELKKLAGELNSRSKEVAAAMNSRPPVATYRREVCEFCEVRHLCNEYWRTLRTNSAKASVDEWGDAQLVILGRHGDSSFNAQIECAEGVAPGMQALLRIHEPRNFQKGDRVRIVNAGLAIDDEDAARPVAIVRIATSTEVYKL